MSEKELLLKDLCARLPYGINVHHRGSIEEISEISPEGEFKNRRYDAWFGIETCKPYLRPMSSMTEDEVNQYYKIRTGEDRNKPLGELDAELFDFYHKNHIDYRGLISMGLALEAPEGMYKKD